MAYFHRWGKEGVEEGVYRTPAQGDPYAEGQRAIKRLERITQNGIATWPAQPKLSGFALQLQREADAPHTLLSAKDLEEFNTTIEVAREMAAMPQELPRRQLNPMRRREVMEARDPFAPFSVHDISALMNPRNLTEEANMYEEFNGKNYLGFKTAYDKPFHSAVKELRVLVASDERGFIEYLNEFKDPRVHITAVSNGKEAMALLRAHPEDYHVVLTDMHMRNGNGIEVAKTVQTEELPCYVVVISKVDPDKSMLFFQGFDGSMTLMRSAEAVQRSLTQFTTPAEFYRSPKEIFNYLSNLVANGGHAYPKEMTK